MHTNLIFTHKAIRATLLVLLLASIATTSSAQTIEPSPATRGESRDDSLFDQEAGETISVNTNLVGVTVRIVDADGRPLAVATSGFRILADGDRQEIAFSEQDSGSTVGIVVDVSASMRGRKAERSRQAIKDFIERADPRNRYVLFTFNGFVQNHGEFGSEEESREEIGKILKKFPMTGETALYDACIEAGKAVTKIAGRSKRALVVFTDGEDGDSLATLSDLRQSLDSLGGLTYVVILDTVLSFDSPVEGRHPFVPAFLIGRSETAVLKLRQAVEGSVFHARTDKELIGAVRTTGQSLMSAVHLGFYPSAVASQPGLHTLAVETSLPSARVQARTRYLIKQ